MRRRRLGIAATAIAVAGVAAAATGVGRGSGGAPSVPTSTPATAQVQRTDLVATERINGTLGYSTLPPIVLHRGGTYTSVPDEGATIQPGQPLVVVDGRPIVLLSGDVPAYRALGPGVTDGDDVTELEAALVAIGFDPNRQITVDRHFTDATAAAIELFQHWFGLAQTGALDLGDVVFEPEPVRVGTRQAQLGAAAAPGDQPFVATSVTRVVTVELDASRQSGVDVGEPVRIDLLQGQSTSGKVASVGRVASTPTTGDASGPARPTVPMTVTIDDPTSAGTFDQQPVQIDLATASRQHVLAVPVTALVALAEGGDGLEVVDPSGQHRYVAVTTGLFTDTLVEITAGPVSEGTTVVVAR
jgi:peptidoglycan hydrolase-like protein with peptidoglycan-binding domain